MKVLSKRALAPTLLLSALLAASIAAAATFDGDSKADVAIFRPSTGFWHIRNSTDNSMTSTPWGDAGDILVPGDYNGDRKTDLAIFRPSAGTWYIRSSADGSMTAVAWGDASDNVVPGDYDGDGKTDVAIFRPSTGFWHIRNSTDNSMTSIPWGDASDLLVPGDYDGDGKTDVAIFRPSTGMWYIRNSSDGSMTAVSWGDASDVVVRPLATAPRSKGFAGPVDVRDYFVLRVGDYSIRSDNSVFITLREERSSEYPFPVVLQRQYSGWGWVYDDVYGFDPSDNTMKHVGYYKTDPEAGTPRIFYRYVPPRNVGRASMRVGDTLSSSYAIVNTNTGDNVAGSLTATLAAIEPVTTPAGTFDNCVKYAATETGGGGGGSGVLWLCPGVGEVKEQFGETRTVIYLNAAGATYGTLPARTVSDVSGMYGLEQNFDNTSGRRWEKRIINVIHNTGNDNLACTAYFPSGGNGARNGALSNNLAFTLTGTSAGRPLTLQGIFSPDGGALVGQSWYDNTSNVKNAFAGTLISPVRRVTGDEDVRWVTPDNTYIRYAYTFPVFYNQTNMAIQRDDYAGMDNGASLVRQTWWDRNVDSLNLIGDTLLGGAISPMQILPSRFTLGQVYTHYDLGGGNSRQISVDQVLGQGVPFGNFPLSLRINIQDNVSGFVSHQYQVFAPGVFAGIMDDSNSKGLASYRAGGASFGNRPSTTPFPFWANGNTYCNVRLQDNVDGGKYYQVVAQIKYPNGTMVTNPGAVTDFRLYSWPSMAEVPFVGSPFLYLQNQDTDNDGTGGAAPAPNPQSDVRAFLDVAPGSLLPGFYQAVLTDNTGQKQAVWGWFDTPTETGKVQLSSMSYIVNGDNSVTFNWGAPTPALDVSKHVYRVMVFSSVDSNGDGYDDLKLNATVGPSFTSYTTPASEFNRLKGFSSLYWQVQVFETANNVVNPDETTKNTNIYRNLGPTQALTLGP